MPQALFPKTFKNCIACVGVLFCLFLLFFFHLRLSFFLRGVQGGIFLFSFSFSLF